MNKNYIYIAVILALLVTFWWVRSQQSSSRYSLEKFEVNISDLGGIELRDKVGNKTNLIKKENKWLVNGSYPVQLSTFNALTEVLEKIEIESPVPEAQIERAIQNIKQHSIEVKLLDDEMKEIKTIYIGDIGSQGNFMIQSKDGILSPVPYFIKQPGFQGSLKYRFLAQEINWKSTLLFHTTIDRLQEISIVYTDRPELSYSIKKENKVISVFPSHDSLSIKKKANQQKLVQYLLQFENKHFEIPLTSDTLISRIKTLTPFAKIRVKDIDDNSKTIHLYRRPTTTKYTPKDKDGNELPFDLDKYWSYIPETKEYVLTQNYVLGPILQTYAYFY